MVVEGFMAAPDMEVVGSDGERVGSVKEVRASDFLINRRLKRDVYVPNSAIQSVSENVVTLSVTADTIDDQGWANPDM